jgi:hypothetical protein
MINLFIIHMIWFPLLINANPNDSIYFNQMLKIQESHINANVPDSNKFDKYLKRDIKLYFKSKINNEIDIEYELLRKEPTQSGVSYPKYYLWIILKNKNDIIKEGALRVAAVDKLRFEITDFLSKDDINKNENKVGYIFPRPLVEGIILKAKNK